MIHGNPEALQWATVQTFTHPYHGVVRAGVLDNGTATTAYPQPDSADSFLLQAAGPPGVPLTQDDLAAEAALGKAWTDWAVQAGLWSRTHYGQPVPGGRFGWVCVGAVGHAWSVNTEGLSMVIGGASGTINIQRRAPIGAPGVFSPAFSISGLPFTPVEYDVVAISTSGMQAVIGLWSHASGYASPLNRGMAYLMQQVSIWHQDTESWVLTDTHNMVGPRAYVEVSLSGGDGVVDPAHAVAPLLDDARFDIARDYTDYANSIYGDHLYYAFWSDGEGPPPEWGKSATIPTYPEPWIVCEYGRDLAATWGDQYEVVVGMYYDTSGALKEARLVAKNETTQTTTYTNISATQYQAYQVEQQTHSIELTFDGVAASRIEWSQDSNATTIREISGVCGDVLVSQISSITAHAMMADGTNIAPATAFSGAQAAYIEAGDNRSTGSAVLQAYTQAMAETVPGRGARPGRVYAIRYSNNCWGLALLDVHEAVGFTGRNYVLGPCSTVTGGRIAAPGWVDDIAIDPRWVYEHILASVHPVSGGIEISTGTTPDLVCCL